MNNESEKTKQRTMQQIQEALGGIVPRWATTLLLAICVFYLHRQVVQQDALAVTVSINTTSIAVLNNASKSTTESLRDLDKISRLIEARLLRLEMKEENRKP